jgi:hypothetical protein
MTSDAPAEAAVLRVLSRYLFCVDAHDLDGVGACFADTAVATYDDKHAGSSRDEIVRHIQGSGVGSKTVFAASCHALASWRIDVSQDTALAESFVESIIIDCPRGSGQIHRRGLRYRDELQRGSEGWVIQRRTHKLQWSYVVEGATVGLRWDGGAAESR